MPIIVGLLAVGVSLAIDKYQERHKNAARNGEINSHGQETGFETGIISPDAERRREEEAFHELQNYADFQKALSSKVLDELSRDDSLSAPYSPNFKASSNRSTGNQRYDPLNGTRYTTQGRLPCPIIISQKAPRSDGVGWVRTYSPALMDCGIPQQPFLKFLDSFNESFQFTPYIEAVNVAALESGIGWRDGNTNLSTAIPNEVRVGKAAQSGRELVTFLDHANISFFSPRGLFAMVITSTPDELSPILTINVFESSNASTTDLNMQGLTFGEIDQGHTSSTFTESNQPQSRRPNKLQKMSTFISEYGDRRASSQQLTSPSNNTPLFSLISTISNSRESKKDSRRRRNHRFQRTPRPSSRSSSVIEGAFGVTKVGKPPGSVKGIMERMRRDDSGDTEPERHVRDAEILPGGLYLVIVNDPGNDLKIADHQEIYDKPTLNIDPSLDKGKEKERYLFEQDAGGSSLPGRDTADIENQQFDEHMDDTDELPPRYSSIHPQHRARVQAWREENPESNERVPTV